MWCFSCLKKWYVFSWCVNRWIDACVCCTLSGGSHCFQPVHQLCAARAAAQGDDRWCLSPSTAQWHTPFCLQAPCCHCLVLPDWNPRWWVFDVLHKKRHINSSFPRQSFCHSTSTIIGTCHFFYCSKYHWVSCRASGIPVAWILRYCFYRNYMSWRVCLFSPDSQGLASIKAKGRKNLQVDITRHYGTRNELTVITKGFNCTYIPSVNSKEHHIIFIV